MLDNVPSPIHGFFRRHTRKMLIGAVTLSGVAVAVIFTGRAGVILLPVTKGLIIAGAALVGVIAGAAMGCQADQCVDLIVFESEADASFDNDIATYRRYKEAGLTPHSVIYSEPDNESSFLLHEPLLGDLSSNIAAEENTARQYYPSLSPRSNRV